MMRRLREPNTMRMIGLTALVLSSLARYLQRIAPAAENLADGLQGLFIGIAIGALLLSFRSPNRQCSK